MKGWFIIVIILGSVTVSTAFYSQKIADEHDELDDFTVALTEVKKYTGSSGAIAFITEPNNLDIYSKARFAIAPLHLAYNSAQLNDTLLAIQYVADGDKSLSEKLHSRTILWQKTDTRYHYTLSVP